MAIERFFKDTRFEPQVVMELGSAEAIVEAVYAGIGFSNDAGTSIMYSRRMGSARARRFLIMNETLDAQAVVPRHIAARRRELRKDDLEQRRLAHTYRGSAVSRA